MDNVNPKSLTIDEALYYYDFPLEKGTILDVKSIDGQNFTKTWTIIFYDESKNMLFLTDNITTSMSSMSVNINVDGVKYVRPNVNFQDSASITAYNGKSLLEKITKNTSDIAINTQAIAALNKEVNDVKTNKLNMYDGLELILGRIYQGVYSDAITTVHCTDYISLVPGHVYAIFGGYLEANYTNYYNASKVYKGALSFTKFTNSYPYTSSYNCAVFTAPSDCYYTRINFINNDLVDGTRLQPAWYLRDITGKSLPQKNVLVIGDSISTDAYGDYKKWVTNLLDDGTFSKGFTLNNSQHATGFLATYTTDTSTRFLTRLTAVGDLTGYDLIITFGGINDWIQSIAFNDFKDAVDNYFEYLIENATQARIVFFSPLRTSLYGTTNNVGKTQKDYDDYIKSVADEYAFPLLNLTDKSGFCPDKSSTFTDMWTLLPSGFTDHDGVHPTADWEKKYLTPQIKQFLEGLL